MFAEFFVHDGGDTQTWRLKGHATSVLAVGRIVGRWCARRQTFGYDASAYALPPLNVHQHTVETEHNQAHGLFAMEAQTLMERRDARRASLVERVRAMPDGQCRPPAVVVWCDLNAEGDALTTAIDGAVQIAGADDADVKEQRLRLRARKDSGAGQNRRSGRLRPQLAALRPYGLRRRDGFIRAYYQAVRRCWRFGQQRPVDVHVFASQQEGAVVANLRRKESDARAMADAMAAETLEAVRENIPAHQDTNPTTPRRACACELWRPLDANTLAIVL